MQGIAYGLLLLFFQRSLLDGWETTTVAFDDFALGAATLAADTRRNRSGPIPPPKDNQAAAEEIDPDMVIDEREEYYDEPHI